MCKYTMRDLLWLTLAAACLAGWWSAGLENIRLGDVNAAIVDDLKVKSMLLETRDLGWPAAPTHTYLLESNHVQN